MWVQLAVVQCVSWLFIYALPSENYIYMMSCERISACIYECVHFVFIFTSAAMYLILSFYFVSHISSNLTISVMYNI